jgi:purine-binding chemotaxis protein CheW
MSIDWNEVHLRLEAADETLARGGSPSPVDRRSILKKRARELAKASESAVTAEDSLDLIEFRLASELYAIEYSFVREVYPLKDFAPLPGTPPFVLGVMNLRGQVLSIVDLRIFFDLPAKGLGELNKVIVLRDERMEFGILADDILGVRIIPKLGVQPPIPALGGDGGGYLLGIADGGLIILDAKGILGDERIVVRGEVD